MVSDMSYIGWVFPVCLVCLAYLVYPVSLLPPNHNVIDETDEIYRTDSLISMILPREGAE